MALPLIFFVVLMWLGREELEFRGILLCLAIWVLVLISCALLDASPHTFVALQALIDVVLVLIIFGGDIRIR